MWPETETRPALPAPPRPAGRPPACLPGRRWVGLLHLQDNLLISVRSSLELLGIYVYPQFLSPLPPPLSSHPYVLTVSLMCIY